MKSLKTPKMMLVCAAILLVSATSMAAITLSNEAVIEGSSPIVTIGVNFEAADVTPPINQLYLFILPLADGAWVDADNDGGLDSDDVTIYPIAGDLAGAVVQDMYKFELTAAGFNNLPQPGLLFTADLEITDNVTVYLAEGSSTNVVDTLDLIYNNLPEPITMSLLGLGGLLVRRKRA